MSAEVLAVIVAVVALVVTLFQWFFSVRAARRQRDVEMVRWASKVVDLLAELESACFPLSEAISYSANDIERLAVRSSALLDRGRFFFGNVQPKERIGGEEGTRVRILDKVLQAHYVARHVAINGTSNGELLRHFVWQARGEFIKLLQKEMGDSLKRSGIASAGDHVPANPFAWERPTRSINLPSR